MTNFEKWAKEFRNQNLYAFNHNPNGLLWLKVRAISRGKQIGQFLIQNHITLHSTKIADQNVELFNLLEHTPDAMQRLDKFLTVKNNEWYETIGVNEAKLKEDLYKIRNYEWGGDQNNSLDKYLISRYIKTISDYDYLYGLQPEIAHNSWNYVQTSWYNNWTSYLIESIFKRHEKVISAVGEIKSVDFFLDGIPIDLKVTFFPNQFMAYKLKERLGCRELTWLKRQAKNLGNITVDKTLPESQQIYTLTEKLSELNRHDVIETLREKHREIISEAQTNPIEIMSWLYANQGEMRFGAENRLFLILVDATDINQSWKMKRAFSLIEPKVNEYLNDFDENRLKQIDFTFNGKCYKSLADVIFIVKH